MNKTIIFISGWQVPKVIAKSSFIWNSRLWDNYRCLWLSSKTPTSDYMVKRELDRLEHLINVFPNATVAGHSLGGWWAANLALRPNVLIKKLVLWTPLCDAKDFPIFNVTDLYHPTFQLKNTNNSGPHKALVYYSKKDLIVPSEKHSDPLINTFNAMSYKLNGGHFYQTNHIPGLHYMKEWIELR